MANQTVSVNRNFDDAAISGLLNGEDLTVNTGATLTINSDVRWGQQAAVIGAITIDTATGGNVLIDGRDVWWVPYDAATGNVPALGTAGTLDVTRGGTPVAEFLGIFTALGVAPTAAAAAIPATGFAKFRWIDAALADNDVLTFSNGATITVNSTTGGQRGWLHIVGETATAITVPRLGIFEARGDWFEIGLTNGADGQTFQFPVSDYCNGVQIETAPGSGIYEWWPAVGTTRWGQNNRIARDTRGKVINSTAAGVIQIALRGAVNNGYKPPSGCRVRIPNIIISTSAPANWALNNYYGTNAAWDFTTTNAGVVLLDRVSSNMYTLCSQPYQFDAYDSSFQNTVILQEVASQIDIQRCCVGLATNLDSSPFNLTSCFGGTLIEDSVGFKYEQENNDIGWSLTDCDAVTLRRCKFMACADNTPATLNRGGTAYTLTLTRVTNCVMEDPVFIGGGANIVGCVNVTITGTLYADCLEDRTTNTTNGVYAFTAQGTSTSIRVFGFSNFDDIANIHPYLGIISFLNAYNCLLQDVGTPEAPYDCGSAAQMAVAANFGGNDTDNVLRRVYLQNTRTGTVLTVNSSTRGRCINVWGDYADNTALAALNFLFQGGRMTGSPTGQAAVYGTHWADHFNSATTGIIRVFGNEPTTFSAAECQVTAGAPRFTSTGQVRLTQVGDQVTWTMPYRALGHTSLVSVAYSITNQANHLFEFQFDTGTGFSAWQDLTNGNLAAVGAINPATGVTLRIRATCVTANTGNQVTAITINTATDAVSQRTQYPLPGVKLSLLGLVPGSEVRAYQGTDPSTAIEVAGAESSGSSFVIDFDQSLSGQTGFIVVFALGYQVLRIPITYPSDDSEIPIQQTIDRVYANP